MDIVTFTIYDAKRESAVTFRARRNHSLHYILSVFVIRQGNPFNGYKYQNREIQNFNLTLSELDVVDGSQIMAY